MEVCGSMTSLACVCGPQHTNHMWRYDFVADLARNGRSLKIPTLLYECTREYLEIDVARYIRAQDVLDCLADLSMRRGTPIIHATKTNLGSPPMLSESGFQESARKHSSSNRAVLWRMAMSNP
jgi:hypothetical protein